MTVWYNPIRNVLIIRTGNKDNLIGMRSRLYEFECAGLPGTNWATMGYFKNYKFIGEYL